MRPSDVYAMPTLSEDDWTRSPAVAVMFGEERAYPRGVTATDLPLRILTKIVVEDQDDDDGDDTLWQVVTWEDRPIGVVVRTGEWSGERVVTDAVLHGTALLALVGLGGTVLDVVDPDVDVAVLGVGGGHVLVGRNDAILAVPARVCAGGRPLVDLGRLGSETMLASCAVSAVVRLCAEGELRDAVLGCIEPGLRGTADYDVALMRERMHSLRDAWVGPLVADAEATYLLCVARCDMDRSIDRALRHVRIGSSEAIDVLCTGVVRDPVHVPPSLT